MFEKLKGFKDLFRFIYDILFVWTMCGKSQQGAGI